jgi:DNA-binding MarR family transcriptional regulator/GNAT superfamily N-acetyltransferase
MSNIPAAAPDRVAAVRAFNRFWTKQIGVLHAGLLRTSYSLTEARVLFELAQGAAMDVAELRRMLELDPGYLSRILASFKSSKLVTTGASEKDARRQVVRLTTKGRKVFETLDARSVEDVRTTLSRLSEGDQKRVVGAMQCIGAVLGESSSSRAFVLRGLGPGDLGWVVQRHGVLYAEEYGWDESFEALVARIVADYVEKRDPRGDGAWVAEMDGEPVGCVFCVRKDARTAQLRLLLTDPKARGRGVGSRLVEECIRFARRAGYARIVLWTNHPLRAARRIYERAGFVLEKEEKHHSFGHDLVGQSFALDLTRAAEA